MKIVGLEAKNVRKIKAINMKNLGNGVIEIAGKNENGKTSVLRSIEMAIGGQKMSGDSPIRNGEKKAETILETEKYRITRVISKSGQQIKVEDIESGEEQKKPQSLLDSFLADFTFDPLSFARLKDKEQFEALMQITTVNFDYDKFVKDTGIELNKDRNIFEELADAEKAVYEKRTVANRWVKQAEAKYNGIEIAPQQMDVKPVSMADLVKERQALEAKQRVNEEEVAKFERLSNELEQARADYEEMKKQLKALQEKGKQLSVEVDKQKEVVENLKHVSFDSIREKESNADTINALYQKAEEKRKAKAEFDETKESADRLDETVKYIREAREIAIKQSNFPVKGLGVNEDGVITLDNVPIRERGTSKQILVGLEICAAMNPELKVILVRDANCLDQDNMKVMAEWAEKKDYQIWIERVADEPGANSFFIEDGEFTHVPQK